MTHTLKVLSLLSVVLSGCGGLGSGRVVETAREVGAFKRLEIHSAFVARATQGERSVVVRTDDNLQHLVITEVVGDTLVVRTDPVFYGAHTVLELDVSNEVFEGVDASGAARVTVPATPSADFPIEASGASEVTVEGLQSETLTVRASGASRVRVVGQVNVGSAAASGGSTVTLTSAPLRELAIDVSGASRLQAHVTERLTGELSGGSTAAVDGQPSSTVRVSGGSTLELSAR